MVGVEGFEPPTYCSQSNRATRLRYTPKFRCGNEARNIGYSGFKGNSFFPPFPIAGCREYAVRWDLPVRAFARRLQPLKSVAIYHSGNGKVGVLENMTGLYIHVPFCVARCRYCDFYRETPGGAVDADGYLAGLDREFSALPDGFAPDTVFIGGGTPTALDAGRFAAMLASIHRRIDLSNMVEFTSEANPGTLSPDKLAAMRDGGINRVSLGVQSFNDRALRLLGRIHDRQGAVAAYEMLRNAGFDNINIDLIQSIPGMDRREVLDDARKVVELGPEHVSSYNLIFEPGTPMARDRDAGRIAAPGDDEEADNYYAVKALLEDAGYHHYEISNFSKPGKACRHNVLYWQGGDYFGCGPSAHSHWKGKRFGNVADLPAWCDRLKGGEQTCDGIEELDPEHKARETLVMWLRMVDGVDEDEFRDATGYSFDRLCGESIEFLQREGLLVRSGRRLALASDALFVCNAVFTELV